LAHSVIELHPDPAIRADLMGLKRIARQGSVAIVLPTTPDGRHADYCPSIVLAIKRRVQDPEVEVVAKDIGEALMWEAMAAQKRQDTSRGPTMATNRQGGRFGR
jgi:hypothetical protein